ncbi:hypothetical protein SSX86_012355 [Deinandra increscens subsp. villosa]|uniref:Bifunctional inhibitor/plant lipid transfer protein/seed storage helical domain-containing protein n=1 Tax=Deinandra increscens subsp. villosa TaxID=3103831 RepID=A0AAP0DBN0_9ASTR
MKMSRASCVTGMIIAMIILMAQVNVGLAQACDPSRLTSCLPNIIGDTPPAPNSECCNNLRAQIDCLCSYVKNPAFGRFLHMPGAKKVAQACSITFPDPKTCT